MHEGFVEALCIQSVTKITLRCWCLIFLNIDFQRRYDAFYETPIALFLFHSRASADLQKVPDITAYAHNSMR